MKEQLKLVVKNSELKVHKDKRIFLTYPMLGLTKCTLEELEDGIAFTFQTKSLNYANEILKNTKEAKLRFLINCANLEKLYTEYDFSLNINNLMTDINLSAHVLLRDAHLNFSEDFLPMYKALIASVLLPKYTYDDFISSGLGLYQKNKFIAQISTLENTQDIKTILLNEYNKTVTHIQQNKRIVSKSSIRINQVTIPLLSIAFFVVFFFAGRFFIIDIPYKNSVISANQAYVAGNFLNVQSALSDIPVSQLTHETKHILSRAYVITEPLNDTQINNILSGLTLITDTSIFDYWIHMGRLEFNYAIDIAQRFGDNELLLFAYLKYEAVVIVDPHMPGEEKLARLNYIENHINNLQAIRENALDTEVFENLLAISTVSDSDAYYPTEVYENYPLPSTTETEVN